MRLEDTVKELLGAVVEEKWFGFKESWYEPTGIGEYISSHSNAAAMAGKEKGYLVWGGNNETHPYNRINTGEPLHTEPEIPDVDSSVVGNDVPAAEENGIQLSARRRSILDAIRENPAITERQLTSLFPMSDTAMQNNLSYLKRNGFIAREGNNRSGRWKVL